MDHLPDAEVMDKFIAKMNDQEAKDNVLFSARVEQEETARCACTHCPPRDQHEEYDYCCKALFDFPLKKKGQLLREGLKEKLKDHESPCVTRNPLFTDFLLSDMAVEASLVLHSYQKGKVDADTNRSRRHACYRVIVACLMGPLGRGIRVRLPACVIRAVRDKWPSSTYTGFKPSEIIDE